VTGHRKRLRLNAIFRSAKNIEQTVVRATKERGRCDQSILAKAFRGELVPQDPNDEPASELLKRIQAARESDGRPRPKKTGKASERPAKVEIGITH